MASFDDEENSGLGVINRVETPVVTKIDVDGRDTRTSCDKAKPTPTSQIPRAQDVKLITKQTRKIVYEGDAKQNRKRALTYQEGSGAGANEENFAKLWQQLRTHGWSRRGENPICYCIPGCDSAESGVEGEDYFTSERAVIEFVYRARKLTNDQNVSPTLASNLTAALQGSQHGQDVEFEEDEQPVYFQGLWPHLKDIGWKCLPGQEKGTYMYLLPNVSSSQFKVRENGFTSKEDVLSYARVHVPKAYSLARQSVKKVSSVSASSSTRQTRGSACSVRPKASTRSLIFDAIWPTLSKTNWHVVEGETCHFKTPSGDVLSDEVDVVMYLDANLKHLISGSILETQDSIASLLETIMKECKCGLTLKYDTAGDLLEFAEEHLSATWKAILVSSTMSLFASLSDVLGVVGVVKVEGKKRFTSASGWNTTEEGVNSFENKFQVVHHVASKMGRYLDLSLKGIVKDREFPQQAVLKVLCPILQELGWTILKDANRKPNGEDGASVSDKALVELVCRKMPSLWKTVLLVYDYKQRSVDEVNAVETSSQEVHSHVVAKPQTEKQQEPDTVVSPAHAPASLEDEDASKDMAKKATQDREARSQPTTDSRETPVRGPASQDLSQPNSESTAPSSIARVGITQQDSSAQEEIFGLSPIAESAKSQTPVLEPDEVSTSPQPISPVQPLSPVVTRSQKKAKKRKARVAHTETPSTRPKRRNDVSVRFCQGPKCQNRISAYGADYCSQHCFRQAEKRKELKEAEKAAEKAKGKRKSTTKTVRVSKAELKEFDTLWGVLQANGWKKGKESGKDVFVCPKVKKNKRVNGKNTFTGKTGVIRYVRDKSRALYDAVYNAEPSDSDEALATPMINGVKGRSRDSCKKAKDFCSRNGQSTRDHLFQTIYNILKKEFGWKYFSSSISLESSYCYAMPHVKSVRAGVVGKDVFHKKEDVIDHVRKEMREVWDRVNGDFCLQIATPVSQMKRTRRKRKVSSGKQVGVQIKRAKRSKTGPTKQEKKRKESKRTETTKAAQGGSPVDDGFEFSSEEIGENCDDVGSDDDVEDEVEENLAEDDVINQEIEVREREKEPVEKAELYRSTEVRSEQEVVASLSKRYSGRRAQITKLVSWLGAAELDTGHFAVVGNVASGKTSVVRAVFRSLELPHSCVDAKEVYDQGVLFRLVLAQMPEVTSQSSMTTLIDETVVEEEEVELQEYQKKRELQIMENMRKLGEIFGAPLDAASHKKAESTQAKVSIEGPQQRSFQEKASTRRIRCSTMSHFALQLQARLRERSDTFYIILDNAERLERKTLAGLLQLKRDARVKVCIVLIARTSFLGSVYAELEHEICFPDYTRDEVESILAAQKPGSLDESGSRCYLKVCAYVVRAFQQYVSDVRELRELVDVLWKQLVSKRQEARLRLDDTVDLNAMLSPFVLMLSRQLFQGNYTIDDSLVNVTEETLDLRERNEMNETAELPYYAKILLVAAYLASYNPKKHDTLLFGSVRNMSKASKRKKGLTRLGGATKNARQVTPQTQIGPMSFTTERLFFIYRSLLSNLQGERIANSAFSQKLYKQLLVLVDLQLLAKTSKEGELDEPTFKCYAGHEYIGAVSKSVQLDLDKFMYH